jgi:hypothetical protein
MLFSTIIWNIIIYSITFHQTTNEILSCMIFPNDEGDTYNDISIEELKERLHYKLLY